MLKWTCGVKPFVKLCMDFLYNRLGIAAVSALKRSRILRLDQPVPSLDVIGKRFKGHTRKTWQEFIRNEPCQTSDMERFVTIVNDFQSLEVL